MNSVRPQNINTNYTTTNASAGFKLLTNNRKLSEV